MSALRVNTLRGAEVALGVGALVDILAGGQVHEGLLLAARDDVGPDQAVALVAAHRGTVLVWGYTLHQVYSLNDIIFLQKKDILHNDYALYISFHIEL